MAYLTKLQGLAILMVQPGGHEPCTPPTHPVDHLAHEHCIAVATRAWCCVFKTPKNSGHTGLWIRPHGIIFTASAHDGAPW